jgi:hypothetical protein
MNMLEVQTSLKNLLETNVVFSVLVPLPQTVRKPSIAFFPRIDIQICRGYNILEVRCVSLEVEVEPIAQDALCRNDISGMYKPIISRLLEWNVMRAYRIARVEVKTRNKSL